MLHRFLYVWLLVCMVFWGLLFNCSTSLNRYEEDEYNGGTILSLTESERVRMVWLKNGDLENGAGTLIGFDSKGNKQHTILHSTSSFYINRPLIYKNGTRIAFTNTYNPQTYETYTIAWDGSDLQFIEKGECSCIWMDPNTKENWFFIRQGGADTNKPIIRVNETNLQQKVVVYDKKPAGSVHSRVWFSVSGDGKRASGCFPWGTGESRILRDPLTGNNTYWASNTRGCWYSMAPDLSYRWFHLTWNTSFNGHTGIQLFNDTVSLGEIELQSRKKSEEHFHAKFGSNSGKLIVASVRPVNLDPSYYDSTEIVVGKLNDNFHDFSSWIQITNDISPDYYPDLWINVAQSLPVCDKPLVVNQVLIHDNAEEQLWFLEPSPKDTFQTTDSITLNWVVKNSDKASGWLIEYSLNDGKKWISFNTGTSFPPGWRSYAIPCSAIVKQPVSAPTSVLIRVHDYFSQQLTAIVQVYIQ